MTSARLFAALLISCLCSSIGQVSDSKGSASGGSGPLKLVDASITTNDEHWTFGPANGEGIEVLAKSIKGEITASFVIVPQAGTVSELVVCARKRSNGKYLIGLGVAFLEKKSKRIQYRMLIGGNSGDVHTPKGWTYSEVLIERASNEHFDIMSVALPGGDSLMLSLQDLTRQGPNDDSIDSYVFVDHCPYPMLGHDKPGIRPKQYHVIINNDDLKTGEDPTS